uniref:Uncharacterized protein n=1 Tax=Glossina brevipalpis TaxID=37001 RepID=A0A1A9X3Z1_9MUSC
MFAFEVRKVITDVLTEKFCKITTICVIICGYYFKSVLSDPYWIMQLNGEIVMIWKVLEKRGKMREVKKKVVKKIKKNISNSDKKFNAVEKENELPFTPENFVNNSCKQIDLKDAQAAAQNCTPNQNKSNIKCLDCENMAKNFLYLQSLISRNFVPTKPCAVCYSALQYLQYVNENLLKIFGNVDSFMEAGKAFANLRSNREKRKIPKQKPLLAVARSVSASIIAIKSAQLKKYARPTKLKKRTAPKKAGGSLILKTKNFSKTNINKSRNRLLITRGRETNSNLNQNQRVKRKLKQTKNNITPSLTVSKCGIDCPAHGSRPQTLGKTKR